MLVPKLRFKREDGTKYPEWEERELKDVAKILMGQSPSGSSVNANKNGIPLVQGKADILGYGVISDRYTSAPTKVSEPNDIIMTVRAPVGYVAKLGFTACIGRGVCAIRANENEDFVYYVLQNKESEWKYIEQGSTFTAVNSDDVSSLIVSIPCFEEQQKIAGFLSTVDEVITQSEAEVQNLEQQKKSAMQKIFSQELRFKREDGTDYPEWEENAISDLFEVSAGGDIDKANSRKEYGEDYPYAVYANVLTNRGLYGYANYYKIGCDCFTVTGRGDVGYAIARHEKFVPIVRLLVCIPKHNENVDCFAEIVNYTNIFVDNTGVPQLTSIQLGKIRVAYPTDIEEQQKIADFLSVLDEAISYAKQELDKWKELKKGLLQQMFV